MHPLVNTYKNIHMHTNMYPLTQANTKLNTHIISLSLFCALPWYLNAHWHCSILLFACTGLNTHVSWRKKKEDMKLKHATKSWNWPYQIGPTINQFLYLHYSILSILCAFSLTLRTIFFPLQLLCTNMKKVAVLQVKYHCQRLRHTHKCCLCKVYKLDVYQTIVTSIWWQKWVTEAGHIITVTGQTQNCPCLQLLELY